MPLCRGIAVICRRPEPRGGVHVGEKRMNRIKQWLIETQTRARRRLHPGTRLWLIGGVTLAAGIAVFLLPPIPQDPRYHGFADQRACFGIPHCLNVVSNIPFFIFGAMGLSFLRAGEAKHAFATSREGLPYAVFFTGALLIGLGSSYYHLAPDDARLVWDRLPMTVSLMAIFAAILVERVSIRAGLYLLGPLLLAGLGSVVYWRWSALHGVENLAPYGAVQFTPLLSIPLILLLFPPRYTHGGGFLGAIAWYAAAKLAEALDHPIFALGHVVGGHALKHLFAAMAFYWVLRMLSKRRSAAADRGEAGMSGRPAYTGKGY
jgi:hypothetical protein